MDFKTNLKRRVMDVVDFIRTAMTIAQGMQKEHESLIRQLDILREVNQKLRDQKDAIQAAHEAQKKNYVSLSDELAMAQSLERGTGKTHKMVTRQGSEMSKYFTTYDGGRKSELTSLSSVDEHGEYSVQTKPKLQRSKNSIRSFVRENSLMEYANEADGAEFESDRVFEEGELTENGRITRIEKPNSSDEITMSETERTKTENQFREQKMNMPKEESLQNSRFKLAENSGSSFEGPLSERKPPVGTENNSTIPTIDTNLQRVFKVVFVGDSGVGKSSFIHRYCYDIWKASYTATIGLDFQVKALEIDRKRIALQLWDTAGQERFRSITKQYFRKADAVVLLYDITSAMSYVNIKSWMTSVEEAAEPGCTVMLIGNKLDLCNDEKFPRVAEYDEAKLMAEDYDILYGEASAKSGTNVNELMETLARVLQEREDWQLHSVLNLKLEEDKKKKKSCCKR